MPETNITINQDVNDDGLLLDNNNIKKKKRDGFWAYLLVSVAIAGVVGLGESLVAVYFMGTVSVSVILAVGLPAFIVSFLLFRSDTFDFLKSLFQRKFFKDNDGKNFTGIKRAILIGIMALAIFAGASSGFLQLNSILTTFGSLFWGLTAATAVAAPPLSLLIVAVSVAAVSAVANMALLYFSVEKFIRNKEYNTYIDIFKNLFIGNKDKNGKRTPLGWRLFHGFFALLGIVAAAVIYVVTLGIFHAQAFTVFNSFCNLSVRTSQILSYVFVHATGQLLNGFFYARSMLNSVMFLGETIKNALIGCFTVAKKVFTAKKPENTAQEQNSDKTPWWGAVRSFGVAVLVFIGLFYLCLRNGLAQGCGAMSEPKSLAWLESIKMPTWLAKAVAGTAMTVASTAANGFACADELNLSGKFEMVKESFGFARSAKLKQEQDLEMKQDDQNNQDDQKQPDETQQDLNDTISISSATSLVPGGSC